jgi:hypothetical protein
MALHAQQKTVFPWQRFWDDQNERLKAFDGFRDDLGDIYDDVLYLNMKTNGSKTPLDFSIFDVEHIDFIGGGQLTLKGETYPLSLKEYAKLAVATSITPKSAQGGKSVYNLLVELAGFLNVTTSSALNADNAEEFHINMLTQKVTAKGRYTRLKAPSYSAYKNANLVSVRIKLNGLGVTGVVSTNLSKRHWEKSLDYACQSVMGITRQEYIKGGGFNTLTLEMGQYYADHLKRVYEQDYLYTAVCRTALRNIPVTGTYQKDVLVNTILGTFIVRKQAPVPGYKDYNKLHQDMAFELYEQYVAYFDKVQSLKEENICRLMQELGLDMRFDAVEIIRVLMLQKYYDFGGGKTPESVWQGYLRSLDKSDLHAEQIKQVSAQDVYARMVKIAASHKLTRKAFMESLNQWAKLLLNGEKKIWRKLDAQLARIEDAMTSLVVAYLGYRASEFGFSLDAISVHSNLDVLDNAHVPFRFKLKWLVPKTNGVTKIDREITSQCYQICAQLHDVFQPLEGSPCLYLNRGRTLNTETSNNSETPISNRLVTNWNHFAKHYQPFVDVYELERLSDMSMETLTPDEIIKLDTLRDLYDLSSARVKHLLAASNEIKRDLMKLNCTGVLVSRQQATFKASIKEYIATGNITDPDNKFVFEKELADETKQWLKGNGDNLDKAVMSNITYELLLGARYPSPHAFRHIWAEAVLTRYQGDVGTVIRHQFCHLDDSFFMAYLRNKEAKGIVQAARMKVLNSVVDTLLIDAGKVGKEYLGGFARYVKKAVSLTDAVTQDKVRTLRDRIMGRVISISPSHFATCVPREGGEGRAKCAEMGDINPQNAKPSFCLGCTNAVITSGNLRGIWTTIQPFAKECLNEDVMGFMVQSHLPTLHSGYKRIKELKSDANAEQVNKILPLIKKAINNVEQKLKAEEGLYA